MASAIFSEVISSPYWLTDIKHWREVISMRVDVLEPVGDIIPRVMEALHVGTDGPGRERVKRPPATRRNQWNPSGPHGPPGTGKVPTRYRAHDYKA